MSTPAELLKFIDYNANKFIGRLGEAVAIPRYAHAYRSGHSLCTITHTRTHIAS